MTTLKQGIQEIIMGESKREAKRSRLDNHEEKHRDRFGDANRVRRPGNNNAETNHQKWEKQDPALQHHARNCRRESTGKAKK
jgi:hypothetical protein